MGTTCEAQITPKWYPSVKLAAEVTSAVVILDDSVGPQFPIVATGTGTDPHDFIELHFKRIELLRKPDGKLSGTASASADFCECQTDFISPGLREHVGSVVATFGPAELYAGPPRFRPLPRPDSGPWCGYLARGGPRRLALTSDLLPWDILAVETSKPVAALSTKLEVHGNQQPGSTTTAGWIDAPLNNTATAADVWAWTHFLDWDQVRGTQQEVLFEGVAAVDGGMGTAQPTTTVSVLDVGASLAEHDLTTGFTGASFGKVVVSPEGAMVTNVCSGGVGGIAGRLQTEGKGAVFVRLRLNQNVEPLVRIAGTSGRQYELESSSLPYGTWTDLKVPIEDETEIGFSIAPYGTCLMLSMKPAVLEVSRVWAE